MTLKERVAQNIYDSTFNKGELSDAFKYSDNKILFPKTGKEIKEKLETVVLKKTVNKNSLLDKINYLYSIMPVKPEDCLDDNVKDIKNGDSDCCDYPKFLDTTYPYEYTNYNENYNVGVNFTENPLKKQAESAQSAKTCLEYNDLCYKCIQACRELSIASTLYTSFKDDEAYFLNLEQLKTLGF